MKRIAQVGSGEELIVDVKSIVPMVCDQVRSCGKSLKKSMAQFARMRAMFLNEDLAKGDPFLFLFRSI
jgi:hypothetical protein